jgi:hypothetical protein
MTDDLTGLTELEQSSVKQGGGGVALRGKTNLSMVGVPISLGKTPGSGTSATFYLVTNKDPAYYNAVVTAYVYMNGKRVKYGTYTLSAATVSNNTNLQAIFRGCASETWECAITLVSGIPAEALEWSLIGNGVENIDLASESNALTSLTTYTGPGTAPVTIGFNAPPLNETATYLVLVQARVESSLVDPVGDSFSTEAVYAWKNIGGVVSLLPVILSAPNTSYDATFATMTASVGAGAGQAEVTFELPATLDASTVTEVLVALVPIGEA